MVYVHAKICVTFFLLLLLMINFVKIFGKLKKSFEKKKNKKGNKLFFSFFYSEKKRDKHQLFQTAVEKKKDL